MKKVYFMILLFLFVFGCAQLARDYSTVYTQEMQKLPLFDYGEFGDCTPGSCVCFVCDSHRSIWENIFGTKKEEKYYPWRDISDGSCEFVTECNRTKFEELWADEDKEIRQFMIGQGTTFLDFNDANVYCKNQLDMAVRWVVAQEGASYPMLVKDSAECFLEHGVIPLYILYSNGSDVSAEAAGNIAKELRDIGPVIITTEIDFDSSNTEIIANVSEQIREIDTQCTYKGKRKCLIALAPRMGDYDGVNKILSDSEIAEKVDIVAFGINNRYSHAKCNSPAALFMEAWKFSEFILYNHSKPSLVAYLLLDSTTRGGAPCWDENGALSAYKYFFPYALPGFVRRGVIGVALYAFNSTEDPLDCKLCRVGLHPTFFDTWFSFCQKYKVDVSNTPRGNLFAVFPNESGGQCNFASNFQYLFNVPFARVGNTGPQWTAASKPPFSEPERSLYRCEVCVNNEIWWPDDLELSEEEKVGEPPDEFCTLYPELDRWASLRDLDAMLVRAVVWQESAFDPCAVSEVSSFNVIAYPEKIIDPDGVCSKSAEKNKRLQAFGIMQTLESPYIYWPPDGVTSCKPGQSDLYCIFLKLKENGRKEEIDIAKKCSAKFNPFNVSHSACMGTYKLAKARNYWVSYVRNRACDLGFCDKNGKVDENKVRIAGTYLALHEYYSFVFKPRNAVESFIAQRNGDPSACEKDSPPQYCEVPSSFAKISDCVGQKNFINYIRFCYIYPRQGKEKKDYGLMVLMRYKKLVEKCSEFGRTGCPPLGIFQDAVRKSGSDVAAVK